MVSSADLLWIGMQNMYPLNIKTAVSAYLFPFDDGG